jgi:hypothetical protein
MKVEHAVNVEPVGEFEFFSVPALAMRRRAFVKKSLTSNVPRSESEIRKSGCLPYPLF